MQVMASVSTVPSLANLSQHINASLASHWPASPSEYSHPELMLLGVAMAFLVLAIVFGKLMRLCIRCLL